MISYFEKLVVLCSFLFQILDNFVSYLINIEQTEKENLNLNYFSSLHVYKLGKLLFPYWASFTIFKLV